MSLTPAKKLGEVKVGIGPVSVAIHPSTNVAYVACAKSGTIVPVDVRTRRKQRPIKVGAEPVGVALSPNGSRFYVANQSSGTIQTFDLTSAQPLLLNTANVNLLGGQPHALAGHRRRRRGRLG